MSVNELQAPRPRLAVSGAERWEAEVRVRWAVGGCVRLSCGHLFGLSPHSTLLWCLACVSGRRPRATTSRKKRKWCSEARLWLSLWGHMFVLENPQLGRILSV